MQFFYAILLLQGLAFGSDKVNTNNANEIKCDAQNNRYIIGMSVYAIEAVIERDHLPKNYKVCPENSSKCGVNGGYFECKNDTWVENHCKCPNMECRKTGMFNDCMDLPKQSQAQPQPQLK